MNKIGVSVLLLTLFYGFFEDRAEAQWTSYLNSHTVNQIAAQDSFIWCATTGAVARFHKLDTTFTKFTNVDRLADNKVQALSIDSSGNLWFVHEEAAVSVFDGVNQWNDFVDLDGIPGNGLSIATQGNRVWVGTDKGVWQLDTGGNPFDSDLAGCPFLNNTVIQAIVVKDTLLWFGTPNGICETSTDSLDICQKVYTTADSLPSNVIQEIIIVGDTLWTGTINGIARKAIIDSIWIPVTNSGLPSTNVRSLAWGNDTLWAGTANGIARWNGTGWETLNVGLLNKSISSILIDSVGVPWVGTLGKGIAKFEDSSSTWTPHFSKDIAHNWVVEVAVDLDGSVWCAHYPKSRQVSHLRLDGEWEIFDAESLWGVTTGFPRSIAVDSYGNKWVGVWGGYDGGTQIVKIESDTFKTFRLPTNSEAVGKVEVDSQNNKWFSGLGIVTSDFIARLASDDSTWIVYRKGVKTEKIFSAIAIDSTDKKWFGSVISGVHRFDDGGTPEDESDDQWETFNAAQGLPSDVVFTLKVDRWNNVWAATNSGAAVIEYEKGIITPYRTDDRGRLLGVVSDIAFDVDGGVWFQTENLGLARRGPDGIWRTYHESDGLVSEDIQSGQILALDIHLETGEVWIGTAHGLSRFQTSYFPKPDIKNIKVYPNPFIPSRGHSFITFNNVPTGATIHIYTLAGELIQELKETGLSLVVWDGLTDRREEAASGLYLFTVKDPQGGKRVGKFVIIR